MRGAWPFLVGRVTCLSDLVSVCAVKEKEREDEREDKGEKRKEKKKKRKRHVRRETRQEKRRGKKERERATEREKERGEEREEKTPLCVRSKRLRVCGQDVSVLTVHTEAF